MATKKVKRKPKKLLIFIIVCIVLLIAAITSYFVFFRESDVKEAKVVSKIDKYGYSLKSNKSKKYKELFSELDKVLSAKNVDEKKYAKIITKMFIVDFYSLSDHITKTDVGGVDFVHPDALENFVVNEEDTIYKYVESNLYGQRKQKLPEIEDVKIGKVTQGEYAYNDTVDEKAYTVTATWTYKDSSIAKGYQTKANFIYVHDGKKLQLVEISDGDDTSDDEENSDSE